MHAGPTTTDGTPGREGRKDSVMVSSSGLSGKRVQAIPWRHLPVIAAVAALLASFAFVRGAMAQESPEQLHRMYDDALKELKNAQERKNQLAEENDKLKATVEDLKKQLAAANQQVGDLKRDQTEQADKTFYLRSHYAAWQAFLRQYPELLGRWKAYMEADFLTPKSVLPPLTIDGQWPPSDEG
jgi:septal ring factor EnvC (AmiA/AmiB activator)